MFKYPIIPILKANIKDHTITKICLLLPIELDNNKNFVKGRLVALIYPVIAQCLNLYLSRKAIAYIRGICPKGRSSCLGNYRRNLVYFEASSNMVTYWACIAIVESLNKTITMAVSYTHLTLPTKRIV